MFWSAKENRHGTGMLLPADSLTRNFGHNPLTLTQNTPKMIHLNFEINSQFEINFDVPEKGTILLT